MAHQSRYNEDRVIDVMGHIIHRPASGLSILFNASGNDRTDAVFLPLSQIEIHDSGKLAEVIVTMPEWLAKEKKLI
jgi:hypothetical protein